MLMTPAVNRVLRWAVWIMLAAALFWIAYRFGYTYMACRGNGGAKVECIPMAATATFIHVVQHVIVTLIKFAAMILP